MQTVYIPRIYREATTDRPIKRARVMLDMRLFSNWVKGQLWKAADGTIWRKTGVMIATGRDSYRPQMELPESQSEARKMYRRMHIERNSRK